MSKKIAAGCLLYRIGENKIKVLLVHPSGEYNKKSPWSIPKGGLDDGEMPIDAAIRETWEETGVEISKKKLVDLNTVKYKSGKIVHGFAAEVDSKCKPKCASWEIDKAEFWGMLEAEEIILPAQKPFLSRLRKLLE